MEPFGVGREDFDSEAFERRGLAGAIYSAAGDVGDLVALGAKFFEHLHPLQVGAVTIGVRKHLMDG